MSGHLSGITNAGLIMDRRNGAELEEVVLDDADVVLDDAADVTIEELESDERVQQVLRSLDAYASTGEDRPLDRLPSPAAAEHSKSKQRPRKRRGPVDPLLGARKEHAVDVRPAKVREVKQPEKSIVINEPQRNLSEVAQEAGLSLDEFKHLSSGDRRARTMLAARLVHHLDGSHDELLRSVLGAAAPSGVRGTAAASSPGGSGGAGPAGGNPLAALPSLEADGTVLAAEPPVGGSNGNRRASSADAFAALPSLDADGTVVDPGPSQASALAADSPQAPALAAFEPPLSALTDSDVQRLAAQARRNKGLLLMGFAALVLVLVAVLLTLDG